MTKTMTAMFHALMRGRHASICIYDSDEQRREIDQFQPKAIDLSTRFRGITTEFVGFIPWSLVLRPIVS